ncbi:MAG: MFS transporter [Burkholderiales bacterium]|nr:MAG: MFS transporter [Burkholderiales bacterium]
MRAAHPHTPSILLGASLMLSLSMGMRQSMGLFLQPVTQGLGVTAADFTLALAVQNVVWGVTQPFVGALADRWSMRWVGVAGTLVYALGLLVTMLAESATTLVIGAGLLVGLALSCTTSSLAMAAASRAVSVERRSLVLGIVSAAGSVGTLVAAPMAQSLIAAHGWQFAMAGFIALAAAMLPAALLSGRADRIATAYSGHEVALTMRDALGEAFGHRGYLTMAAAFFVCGLQLVFLTNHLPNYLAICGMDPMLGAQTLAVIGAINVIGSYLCGWLGGRYPKHLLLGGIYILRSLTLAAYFIMPPSTASTLLFGAAMGMLWLGVVPLINGLVAQIFGLRFMATLTGIAFFSHQVGSFLGGWGGGLIYTSLGSYDLAWKSAVAIGMVAGAAQMTMNVRPTPRMAHPVAG